MSEQQHAVRHMLVEENIKLQKRIEALESALREIIDMSEIRPGCYHDMQQTARVALAPETEK